MKYIVLLFVVICGIAASHKKLQSPKAAEFEASLGVPMRTDTAEAASLVDPPKISVYKRTFEWVYPMEQFGDVQTFKLYMGMSSGSYTIVEDAGTNFTGTNFLYTFQRTNWVERTDRHFAVVTAADWTWMESLPSNEVHWPAFPPDHFRLMWLSNWTSVNVYSTSNLFLPKDQWPLYAMVMGTNQIEGPLLDCGFFVIDKPDVLSITVFTLSP